MEAMIVKLGWVFCKLGMG